MVQSEDSPKQAGSSQKPQEQIKKRTLLDEIKIRETLRKIGQNREKLTRSNINTSSQT